LPVLITLLLSCTKDVTLPDLEGSLVGYVYTFDEYGTRINANQDVEISAVAGLKEIRVRTDPSGRFEFKNLLSGTYDLVIEKEGYGTMKQYSVQHLGGKPTILTQAFFLYQPSTATVSDLSIEGGYVYATINFNGNHPEYVQVILYISKNQGFDIENVASFGPVYLYPEDTRYKGVFYQREINFQNGETGFFKGIATCSAYYIFDRGASLGGISYYFDYILNKTIYPNASTESSEYTFTVQ
jgi:hypothetical protein